MKTETMIRTLALFSIAGAAGLLVWWFSMPVFLPVAEAANNFQALILDDMWTPVNILGLLSTLLITLGFPGFYLSQPAKFNRLGFAAMVLATAGLILFVCIQYYETLLWPAAATVHPELVRADGNLVSGHAGVLSGLLASGIILGAGYILFGISALQTKALAKVPVWLILLGAPVFGNGILFPVRTIGLLLFVTGTLWLAINAIREQGIEQG